MNSHHAFSQKLATVNRHLAAGNYDAALKLVESMRSTWPGNAQLVVLWARLVQLQDQPAHDLADAKVALQEAIALEESSPVAAIELGYFLDNVEDDPKGAARVFAEAVDSARRILLDALIGQAKALQQLRKRSELLQCLEEIIRLARFETRRTGVKGKVSAAGIEAASPENGIRFALQLKGPRAQEVEEILGELISGDLIFSSR